MKEESIVLRKLIAADGYVLTNGAVYGKEIYLGKFDSAENWHEITDAEHAAIVAAEKEERENA